MTQYVEQAIKLFDKNHVLPAYRSIRVTLSPPCVTGTRMMSIGKVLGVEVEIEVPQTEGDL